MNERYLPFRGLQIYLAVDESIIKPRSSRLIPGRRIYHPSRPRPIQGTQTHRAWLTGSVNLTPGQLKISQMPAGVTHSHDLRMSGRIICRGHLIATLPHYPAFLHDNTPEWATHAPL